jgi:hypothetical protein
VHAQGPPHRPRGRRRRRRQGGEHATDPAKLVAIYFSNLGDFSRDYVRNPYLS